jgi:tetratricopeptide (TPR) repeat protein
VSTVPAEIAGIPTSLKLRVSPGFDPLKSAVGPEEYFVLSRIDGVQSLRDVLMATGLPMDRAVQIVTRLRSIGALLLPNETSPPTAPPPARSTTAPLAPELRAPAAPIPVQRPAASNPQQPSPAQGGRPAPAAPSIQFNHDLRLPHPTKDELAALDEQNDLDDTERRRILAMQRLLEKADPYTLLGVSPAADDRTLKRAYFLLSKEIHPDRYYGQKLGSFGPRLSMVFEAASRAYARLTGSDKARAAANSSVERANASSAASQVRDQPQTPQEYAAELFDRACQLEVGGDALGAMKLFAAAVRVDPQTRYLRRATSCALAANQPRSAVEYAKKAHSQAPNDVSSARLLAAAFRAAGKLSDAEEVLVMAMAMKSENDVLTSELRNDLAEVRRLLTNP